MQDETYVDTNHIACSFPLSQEIDADTTSTSSTKAVDFLARSKLVALHLLPAVDPLDDLALRKNGQVAISLTYTTVAVLDGKMPSFLLGQVRMREAKAYVALRCLQSALLHLQYFPSCYRRISEY